MHVYSTLVDVIPAPLDHFELKGISIAFELWLGEWDIRDCEAFKIPVSELLMRPDEMTALTQRDLNVPARLRWVVETIGWMRQSCVV